MELVLAILIIFLLAIVFAVGFLVGGRQSINRIKKDGGYFDTEITGAMYPYITASFVDEVPVEFLTGGDTERMLHIAGVKEASFEKQKEWADERKGKVETQTTLSMEDLLNGLDKNDLQLKAGIKQHTHNEEAVKIASKLISIQKDVDPIKELQKKTEAARKEADRVKTEMIKGQFEALPLSRLSVEGMHKIIELVREDIQNQVKEIEKNTPEIKDELNEVKPKRKYAKSKKVKNN